jgi:hypothetical protein
VVGADARSISRARGVEDPGYPGRSMEPCCGSERGKHSPRLSLLRSSRSTRRAPPFQYSIFTYVRLHPSTMRSESIVNTESTTPAWLRCASWLSPSYGATKYAKPALRSPSIVADTRSQLMLTAARIAALAVESRRTSSPSSISGSRRSFARRSARALSVSCLAGRRAPSKTKTGVMEFWIRYLARWTNALTIGVLSPADRERASLNAN